MSCPRSWAGCSCCRPPPRSWPGSWPRSGPWPPPLADMLQPMPYSGMFPPEEEEYHPTAVARTMFVDTVDREVAGTIMEHLGASDAPIRVAQLRVLGGAMARVPVEATAYAHRHRRVMVNIAAFYDGPDDKVRRQAWVDGFAAAIHQGDGAYVNFLADEG